MKTKKSTIMKRGIKLSAKTQRMQLRAIEISVSMTYAPQYPEYPQKDNEILIESRIEEIRNDLHQLLMKYQFNVSEISLK